MTLAAIAMLASPFIGSLAILGILVWTAPVDETLEPPRKKADIGMRCFRCAIDTTPCLQCRNEQWILDNFQREIEQYEARQRAAANPPA